MSESEPKSDVKFVDGIRVFLPHEKAPDFVKLNLLFEVEKLVAWLEANKDEEGTVRADLKQSKGGNLYLSLNDYKPEKKEADL